MISQEQLKSIAMPVVRSEGRTYEKFRQVIARPAKAGEHIVTTTSDGKETENTADPGDMIITNQTDTKEQYIVSGDKFNKRYKKVTDLGDGMALYDPLGKVHAVEVSETLLSKLGLGEDGSAEAPWGEAMRITVGDFIATPPTFDEIYRIARKEFFETYRPLT